MANLTEKFKGSLKRLEVMRSVLVNLVNIVPEFLRVWGRRGFGLREIKKTNREDSQFQREVSQFRQQRPYVFPWKVIKDDLPGQTKNDIETYRPLVLNALSHYNTERHEIRTELTKAIQSIKNLKDELANL